MKTTFINALSELMELHEDVIIITADMGYSVFESIQKRFPKRFFNTGATEQASVGFAAGIALAGYKVFFYAQAAFATMRCFEQIRLDLAYNNLNVKIIGSNAGLSLNQLGTSHFSVEDVALMRSLPGMNIFTPGDSKEMIWAIKTMYSAAGPAYLRFTKLGSTIVHKGNFKPIFGNPCLIRHGKDAVLFISGGLLETGLEVRKLLASQSIDLCLYSVPTIQPINKKIILKEAKRTNNIFTLEEHSINGALGTAVAEILADNMAKTQFARLGLPEKYINITGSINYLLDYCGLSAIKIAKAIKAKLIKKQLL